MMFSHFEHGTALTSSALLTCLWFFYRSVTDAGVLTSLSTPVVPNHFLITKHHVAFFFFTTNIRTAVVFRGK